MISFDLDVSLGILAITVPAVIFVPLATLKTASIGRKYLASLFFAVLIIFPFSSTILICGFKSLLFGFNFQSITDLCEIPVEASTVSLDEKPSIISLYSTVPVFSEIIGIV